MIHPLQNRCPHFVCIGSLRTIQQTGQLYSDATGGSKSSEGNPPTPFPFASLESIGDMDNIEAPNRQRLKLLPAKSDLNDYFIC